jgi:CubicO group peptidase (beta-lactamase class C family)
MSQQFISGFLNNVDEQIISTMNDHALIGLGIGIVQGNEVIYARGFGWADTTQQRPVTPDTTFRIGSLSKTCTALGFMQLCEQGLVQLDDPINPFLKFYQVEHAAKSAPPVTFRHILTHTAGFGELRTLSDLFRPVLGLAAKPGQRLPSVWEYYAHSLQPEVYPQMKFAYSNHAFATLGQAIEDISGQPFADYMVRHVFDPLGMAQTDYNLSPRVAPMLAQGYTIRQDTVQPVTYQDIIVKGAGSVCSSVADMCRYMLALLNNGSNDHGTVLKPETLDMMLQPHYQLDERLPAIGLSFGLEKLHGHRIASHSGSWPGFTSAMYLAPDAKTGIVVLANTSSIAPITLALRLLQGLLDIPPHGVSIPRSDILGSPHLWEEVCGFYAPDKGMNTNFRIWALLGGEVEVFVKQNHLHLRSLTGPLSEGVRLFPADPDDPFVFATSPETPILWPSGFSLPSLRLVFKRNMRNHVDRLCAGMDVLYKRPLEKTLRFRSMLGSGLVVGFLLAVLRRHQVMRQRARS